MDQIEIGRRLARAREGAGFGSARAAAEALGVPIATYAQHENGIRGFKLPAAKKYATRYRTTPEWLLYGKGGALDAAATPTDEDLEEMIRTALLELPAGTPLGDFPRYVAPALRAQLERYRDEREGSGISAGKIAPDRDAQSLSATRASVRE